MKASRIHDEITIEYGGKKANVDKGMAELILECWKLEIETSACCESGNGFDDGMAYITFVGIENVIKFFNAVSKHSDKLYKCMQRRYHTPECKAANLNTCSCSKFHWRHIKPILYGPPGECYIRYAHLSFPEEQIAEITVALKTELASKINP